MTPFLISKIFSSPEKVVGSLMQTLSIFFSVILDVASSKTSYCFLFHNTNILFVILISQGISLIINVIYGIAAKLNICL